MQAVPLSRLLSTSKCDACAYPDASPVWTTLYFNVFIGAILLAIFETFRHKTDIYLPRLHNYAHRTPAAPPRGLGSWLRATLAVSDDETLAKVGMDGFVLLRFLKVCTVLTGMITVFGFVVLAPVYGTGYNNFPGYYKITMSNITADGSRLWAAWIACYVYSGLCLLLLHREYAWFSKARIDFLANGDIDVPKQQTFSVKVEKIPPKFRTNAGLHQLFDRIFPNCVECAYVCRDLSELDKLVDERQVALISLERAVAMETATGKEQEYFESKPGIPCAKCCSQGEKHNAVTYWQRKLDEMNDKVALEQRNILSHEQACSDVFNREEYKSSVEHKIVIGDESADLPTADVQPEGTVVAADEIVKDKSRVGVATVKTTAISAATELTDHRSKGVEKVESYIPAANEDDIQAMEDKYPHSSTGFVTFSARFESTISYQVLLTYENFDLLVTPAPAPLEMIWRNAAIPIEQTESRRPLTNFIFSMGVLCWGLVLAFISALASLSNLTKLLPFLKPIVSVPVIGPLLQAYLPTIVLIIFIAMLASIIAAVGVKFEGLKSKSVVQNYVLVRFFYYQVATICLIVLAGSLLNALKGILKDPSSTPNILVQALPNVSQFFLSYVLVKVFLGLPLELLRIGPLILKTLLPRIFDERKKPERELQVADEHINYGTEYPNHILILMIALLYSVIVPIIVPVCCLYFAGNYVVKKYSLLYIYKPEFESGGTFWYPVFGQANIGLLVAMVTMLGFLAVSKGAAQTPLLLPLIFIIVIVRGYTSSKFERSSKAVSLHQARDSGKHDAGQTSFSPEFYMQPSLTEAKQIPQPYRAKLAEASVEGVHIA